jgi:hypothetical protein
MRIMHPTGLRDWVVAGGRPIVTAGVVSAPVVGSYRANLLACRCISGIMAGGIAIALPLNGFPIALVPQLPQRQPMTQCGTVERADIRARLQPNSDPTSRFERLVVGHTVMLRSPQRVA